MAKTLEQIQAEMDALKTQFSDFSALSPVSYYTHQYSGEEIDESVGVTQDTVPTLVRPNLLDNWYFGRPVNQRGGYIALQGTKCYLNISDAQNKTNSVPVVPTQKVVPSGTSGIWKFAQSAYYVRNEDIVPGYCTAGYSVDRWIQGFDGTMTSTLTDNGIKLMTGNDGTYKNFEQVLPDVPTNSTFTLSFLVDNYASVNQIYTGFSASQFYAKDNLISVSGKTGSSISGRKSVGIQVKVGKTATILAAKLELGPTQTLAHKEGDKWVLNEVPDYGEQLRRCQRYCRVIGGTTNQPFCNAVRREATVLEGFIPIDNLFRTVPSISVNGFFSVIPDFHGVKFTSGDTLSPQGVSLFFARTDGGTFDKDAYLIYAGADTRITLSADL